MKSHFVKQNPSWISNEHKELKKKKHTCTCTLQTISATVVFDSCQTSKHVTSHASQIPPFTRLVGAFQKSQGVNWGGFSLSLSLSFPSPLPHGFFIWPAYGCINTSQKQKSNQKTRQLHRHCSYNDGDKGAHHLV